ncbi:N-6 DNA methylase [Paenactinomyces guangxiensis]|uniref:site-specific DNA-methyltransferase (adenine-specific) n=1 Tax=Paenactinomyces guangxiensis TaxID=1490290 RepID=A0A7W1WQ47_9BACL|nr:type I restriction-modification system subunit M [Paenactinomyces guangxiensis]MBA4494004.1 N-6 DNA methylase [Paenactinomyces guangxiensis]MBH8591251.1 N-6 DNA methylase [Paenactinomyces guangxiensis]
MNNREIVQKLWNLCNVLRDDGITYQQYVTELTYLLFLKMMKEKGEETEAAIPETYRWDSLTSRDGVELKEHYQRLLLDLGKSSSPTLRQIYADATSSIAEPKNLEKIIKSIDALDWYSAKQEGLGDLYEGLLEKNASEKKSGAGQYFTPRVLIDVMVELTDPKIGERCNDPACGTFGFMIAADHYLRQKTDEYFDLSPQQARFQRQEAFSGMELVKDTHRLALMNAQLHGMESRIEQGDSLSNNGKWMKNFDVILTNPPFGTKKGGERATRDDLTHQTSNKQLNFLQIIYNALKDDTSARAAVVLPDNVLFESGVGATIRRDLMNKCNLHTILRLPTGIFYAQGVKTNVLFFNRGATDQGSTKEVWVYDLRTNMPGFGKRNPLTHAHFAQFMEAYRAKDRHLVKDERWNRFTREEIARKGDSLDIGLIADESLSAYENLPDPVESAEEAIGKLEQAVRLLNEVVEELKAVEK